MFSVSHKEIKKSQLRILLLRVAVLCSLLLAGALLGYFGHRLLSKLESKLYYSQFDSLRIQVQSLMQSNLATKVVLGNSVSGLFGIHCPNANIWPNCSIPGEPYYEYASKIGIGYKTSSFAPIIKPNQAEEFKAYFRSYYLNDTYYPDRCGISADGEEIIWKRAPDYSVYADGHAPDESGKTSYNSSFDVLVPLAMVANIDGSNTSMFYNFHSDPNKGSTIDKILNCSAMNYAAGSTARCLSIMNNIFLARNNTLYVSSIYSPIYPSNDRVSEVVGMTTITLYWDELIEASLPPDTPSIYVVIKGDNTSVTYVFSNGVAILQGEGDLHDRKFSELGKDLPITPNNTAADTINYCITIYPSHEYFDYYHSEAPVNVVIGVVAIIAFTILVFGGYDNFVKNESLHSQILLDAKRVFVRFISHEIRTPLNAVTMGLKLMEQEIQSLLTKGYIKKQPDAVESIQSCMDLIKDVTQNSDSVVLVLNDLINYDKIEMRTLKIQYEDINVWDLVIKNIKQLRVTSDYNNVEIKLVLDIVQNEGLEIPFLNDEEKHRLRQACLIGDDVKLGQVIRNVVTNALKFSSNGSEVIVRVKWCPTGLSSVKLPKNVYTNAVRYGSMLIEIQDHGPGIVMDKTDDLFSEGGQFNPNNLQVGQGSGLGLWISKGIIELHGGRISATSSTGKDHGTTFTIELPLYEGDIAPIHPEVSLEALRLKEAPEPVADLSGRAGQSDSSITVGSGNVTGYSKVIPADSNYSELDAAFTPAPLANNGNVNVNGDVETSEELHKNGTLRSIGSNQANVIRASKGDSSLEIVTTDNGVRRPERSLHGTPEPAADRKSRDVSSHSAQKATPPPPNTDYKSFALKKVLVVDDAPSNRKMLCRLLKGHGYTCVDAMDGQQCLDVMMATPTIEQFDLILMDYEMPVMNGPTATKKLREMGYTTLIFGVTGNVLVDDVNFFLNHGANVVLPKPLNIDIMKQKYEELSAKEVVREVDGAGSPGSSGQLSSSLYFTFEESQHVPGVAKMKQPSLTTDLTTSQSGYLTSVSYEEKV